MQMVSSDLSEGASTHPFDGKDIHSESAIAPTQHLPPASDDDQDFHAPTQPFQEEHENTAAVAPATQLYNSDTDDDQNEHDVKTKADLKLSIAPTQLYDDNDDKSKTEANLSITPTQLYNDDDDDKLITDATVINQEEPMDLLHDKFESRRGLQQLVSDEGSVYYRVIASTLSAVSSTRSRLSKERALVNAFSWLNSAQCEAEEFEATAYLLAPVKDSQTGGHRLQPDFISPEGGLGLGWRSVIEQAILDATGCSRSELTNARKKASDSAEAAAMLLKRLGTRRWCFGGKPRTLTVTEVRDNLLKLGLMNGPGANSRKSKLLTSLFGRATPNEMAWLIRTCNAHMSCGISLEASVIPALAQALNPRCPTQEVRAAYARRPDVRCVIDALLQSNNNNDDAISILKNIGVSFGIPLQPMLATAGNSIQHALRDFGSDQILAEHKYDGQRAQIHYADGTTTMYSRKLDEITNKYPQLVHILNSKLGNKCIILDAEIVAENTDGEGGQVFQALTSKRDDVSLVVFDLLWFDNRCICDLPLFERRRLLIEEVLPIESSSIRLAKSIQIDRNSLAIVQKELMHAVAANCEGLVLKQLDSKYEISGVGIRSKAWLKLKKDYIEGMVDSLDLVPIGGWRGSGRKSNWISPILMATYDQETQELACVSRVMSGFSDEFYAAFTKRVLGPKGIKATIENDISDLNLLIRNGPAPGVNTSENCEFWFKPGLVWEIRAADITLSPTHRSAMGIFHAKRGLSLRFPRFIRERPDKRLEQATSSSQFANFYRQQQSRGDTMTLSISNAKPLDDDEKETPLSSKPKRRILHEDGEQVARSLLVYDNDAELSPPLPLPSSTVVAEEDGDVGCVEQRRLILLGADES